VVFIYTVSGVVRGERGIYIYRVRGGDRRVWYLYIPCQGLLLPLKMDLTEGSETSAKLNLTPGEMPKRKHKIQNMAKL
jgi:hypothetical protein